MTGVPAACALALALLAGACTPWTPAPAGPAANPETLHGASRRDREGWTFVHLEGTPERMGFQHGYLLADEIDGVVASMRATVRYETERDWQFFRATAQRIFWPRVPDDLRAEIRGLVAGLRARGKRLDEWDLVAENAYLEIAWYYVPSLKRGAPVPRPPVRRVPPGSCSAFVATGSWTRGGKVVMGHNNWVGYWLGRAWTVLFDLAPARGHHFVMDGLPGLVHSGDDFYISDAGLMITETTIAEANQFDRLGVPEFVRARRAIQLADSIEAWVETMSRDSNGAYANDWLIGDRKSGDIAQLSNGLHNQRTVRLHDGFFVGANFGADPKLVAEETNYRARPDSSMEARRRRWMDLMRENKGDIDVEAAKHFLADHFDVVTQTERPSSRTLCGHGDLDPDPRPEWHEAAFQPTGAVTSKATDSDLAAQLALWVAAGHACGLRFDAAAFLRAHPEFGWQKTVLRDLPGAPWALVSGLR
ncbi:MAG TPA: C45 family peptidase [Polyangia bacterium]|nr:C45 family peptidase [Polyangia bacterium]